MWALLMAEPRPRVLTQTEEVYKRKHVYRTEVFQIQDYFIKKKRNINQALIAHAAVAHCCLWANHLFAGNNLLALTLGCLILPAQR